jgi:hypothetical protein
MKSSDVLLKEASNILGEHISSNSCHFYTKNTDSRFHFYDENVFHVRNCMEELRKHMKAESA